MREAVRRTTRPRRALAAIVVAAALVVATGTAAVAGTITIQPSKLSRLYKLQHDGQDFRRAGSHGGLSGFWYQLDIPVGMKIIALRYVHECWDPSSACRTTTSIWRVKADDATPLQAIYSANYALYDNGLWVDGAKIKDADAVVRSGWRYYVYAACQDENTLVGEIKVAWQ